MKPSSASSRPSRTAMVCAVGILHCSRKEKECYNMMCIWAYFLLFASSCAEATTHTAQWDKIHGLCSLTFGHFEMKENDDFCSTFDSVELVRRSQFSQSFGPLCIRLLAAFVRQHTTTQEGEKVLMLFPSCTTVFTTT